MSVDKYFSIIPEYHTISKSGPVYTKYKELPCFDYIYDSLNLNYDDYPSGIIISSSGADKVVDCLYQTSDMPQEKCGTHGDIVIPMFIIEDKNENAVPVDEFRHKDLFTTYIEKYSDMLDIYKVTQDGFFQLETDMGEVARIADNIFHSFFTRFTCTYNYRRRTYDCSFTKNLSKYNVRMITDEDILKWYREGNLYSYVEKYCFCYIDRDLDYLYEPKMIEYVNEVNGIVEPVLLESDIDDGLPVLKYHVIMFPDYTSHMNMTLDLVQNEYNLDDRIVSFHSSYSVDPINCFFRDNKNLLLRGRIKLNVICNVPNTTPDIETEITVSLNQLRNNKKFIDTNINAKLLYPIEHMVMIRGYGYQVTELTNTYTASTRFLNTLKLRSDNEVKRVSAININKYAYESCSELNSEQKSLKSVLSDRQI